MSSHHDHARPPPWHQRLISPLTRVWEQLKIEWREAGEEAARQDPWGQWAHEEQLRICKGAALGRIPHEEAVRLYREVDERRKILAEQLGGPPPEPETGLAAAAERWLFKRLEANLPPVPRSEKPQPPSRDPSPGANEPTCE